MNDFRIRITSQDNPDLVNLFQGNLGVMTVEMEGTAAQHFHGIIYGINRKTLESRIKKYYKGNKEFSINVIKDMKFQRGYIFKGDNNCIDNYDNNPKIIYNSEGLDIFPEEEKKYYWTELKLRQIKNSSKDFKNLILNKVKLKYDQNINKSFIDLKMVVNEIIDTSKELGKLPPSDYLCISYYEYILQNLDLYYLDKLKKEKYRRLKERINPIDFFINNIN